jgi:hypothetical protein
VKGLLGAGAAVALTAVLGMGALTVAVFPADEPAETVIDADPIACALPGDATTAEGLTAEQTSNAATIIGTGRELGFPDRGLIVAIATAMQESTLNNIDYGDRDSVGLFQQRAPWGSFEERMDPKTSATLFYTGGRTGQPGLDDIEGWESMSIAAAAQAVQVSAFPSAYAKWEPLATQLVGGVACDSMGPGAPLAGNTLGEKAVNAAAAYIGTPYSWGGGGIGGPSTGICGPAGCQALTTVGFDCSGLTQYAWHAAAGVDIGGTTYEQWPRMQKVPISQLQPGDLVFYGADLYHVGIYAGGGRMIEAPRTGLNVRYSSIHRGDLRPFAGRVATGDTNA